MISGKDLDWQKLTADTEWLGYRWSRRATWPGDRKLRTEPDGAQTELVTYETNTDTIESQIDVMASVP